MPDANLPTPWISVTVVDDLLHQGTHAVVAADRAGLVSAIVDLREAARASVTAMHAGHSNDAAFGCPRRADAGAVAQEDAVSKKAPGSLGSSQGEWGSKATGRAVA